jgi:hypothetical protein
MDKAAESKRAKFLGFANRSFADYIPLNKIDAFEKLFRFLVKHYGTVKKAEKEMQVQKGCINRFFIDKKLSLHYAKKILNQYYKVTKKQTLS